MIKKYRNFYMVYCVGSGFAAFTVVLNYLVNVINTLVDAAVNHHPIENVSFFVMYIYAMTLSLYGIYCGVKIANNSPKSKKYLRYYLIPQIPMISIPGFIYYFKLGFDFTLYFILDSAVSSILSTRINFSIGSFFNMNFDTSITRDAVFVGLNIIPILLLASLVDAKKLVRKKAAVTEIEQAEKPAKKARKKPAKKAD